ncbi:hypothetical protein Taro_049511 [Colocasia esculenta]|uniref:HAT C-terminal dimerisation domain-containing protein n=1 Tax=Colocasia esculenta TaxID=4460 RepID=A0A843XB66_COLES|nr:hypothetical protein [Colocasia esculenta]
MVNGNNKNDTGFLYEAIDRVKLELRQSLPRDYKKWWKIIDHKWENNLYHDLHVAGDWWIMVNNRDLGSNALTFIAIWVLSQTTSASQCDRNWSMFSLIHSKVRNHVKTERLEKLVYCHYNMRLRIKHVGLRQQLKEQCHADDTTGQIDVDVLFDDVNPLQSWAEVREEIDDPIFDPTNTTRVERILDGDEQTNPEFSVSVKRPRVSPQSLKGQQLEMVKDTEEQPKLEPTRYSKSDNRSVTPRMVKPPPSLKRATSKIYMIERASTTARDNPAMEKENDDDDDPSAAVGTTTGGGIYTQLQSDYGHDSQGDYKQSSQGQGYYGHHSEGQYRHDSQGHYGHDSGYGPYSGDQ